MAESSTLSTVWSVAAAIILSFGGGGAIVALLSSWLGKLWAERLMERERAAHEQELSRLRADLEARNQTRLAEIQRELDIQQEKQLGRHREKFEAYRNVVDVVTPLLADFNRVLGKRLPPKEAAEAVEKFDRERLRLYGHLALVAPQSLMDAHDALMDYLLGAMEGSQPYGWKKIRSLALVLVNEARKDVALDAAPVEYLGKR